MITSWRLTKADPHPAGKRSTVPLREQEAEIQRKRSDDYIIVKPKTEAGVRVLPMKKDEV